jgi:hypothetical protein
MMSLNELAEEYFYSAQKISQTIEELLNCRRKEMPAIQRRELNLRLRALREIRMENMDVANLLLHYYDQGGHIYEGYRL